MDENALTSDDQYAISNGGGYGILISWDEYTILDRELDTPYPMEVDTPYSTVDQNSWDKSLDMAYPIVGYGVLGIRGVGTRLRYFRYLNTYLEYDVLSLSGYGVLSFILLWSLVSAGTDTPYLLLMDTAYWSSE
ncbi:hypothetical protein Tco_1539917 [Tanacetum coccineum]